MGLLMQPSPATRLKPRAGWWMAAALAVVWMTAGCDFQPLTTRDLFGVRDAGAGDGATSEGGPQTCAVPCGATEFCDELTGQCASRTGNSMLSGVVRDACTGAAVDALVGIAGHHQCSATGKGSYFFPQLPVGKLKLAAAKEGYRLFDTTVVIAPGGTILDVDLTRDPPEDCTGPRPADVTCTCAPPQCLP
jgi:hypothetical protein